MEQMTFLVDTGIFLLLLVWFVMDRTSTYFRE
jgi:hypothetical protein